MYTGIFTIDKFTYERRVDQVSTKYTLKLQLPFKFFEAQFRLDSIDSERKILYYSCIDIGLYS